MALCNLASLSQLDCNCVKRVQIVNSPTGGTTLAWEVADAVLARPGPYHFYIDFARAGSNEWETLNTIPIVDDCMYVDFIQRQFSQISDGYYRVRVVFPNDRDPLTGKCLFCISPPQPASGVLCKKDWLIAREVIRKEYLYQKIAHGSMKGYILKRRKWGQKCSECREYDTEEVQAECQVCYSTGFTGGYYRAIDYTITLETPWGREFERNENFSVMQNIVRQGRAVNYPLVETNDVFIRRDNGERFKINKVTTLVEVSGMPIIVAPELKLAPATDIIYTVPLSGGSSSQVAEPPVYECPIAPSSSSSSSSEAPSDDCDYRAGVGNENDW